MKICVIVLASCAEFWNNFKKVLARGANDHVHGDGSSTTEIITVSTYPQTGDNM